MGIKGGFSINHFPNDVSKVDANSVYAQTRYGNIDGDIVAVKMVVENMQRNIFVGYDQLSLSLSTQAEWLVKDDINIQTGFLVNYTRRKIAFDVDGTTTRIQSFEIVDPTTQTPFIPARIYNSVDEFVQAQANVSFFDALQTFYLAGFETLLSYRITDHFYVGLGGRYHVVLQSTNPLNSNLFSALISTQYAFDRWEIFLKCNKVISNMDARPNFFSGRPLTYRPLSLELGAFIPIIRRQREAEPVVE